MSDLDFLLAETGIRQLHARYIDAVWRKDYEQFGDCFTEDAEWRITGMVMRGREEILASIKTRLPFTERVIMTFRTPLLHVNPDGTASSRTYVTELNAFKNGRPGSSVATYWERFVKQGDRWRFKWRLFQLHYLGTAEFTDPMFDNPDYGPPPNMPPLDAVPAPFNERAWPPKKKAKAAPAKKKAVKKKAAKKKAKKK